MTETRKRPPGRPREFEPTAAARKALEAFWARGFREVSVPELEQATGVVRTSLYNTFGNKRGVFDAALEVYLADLFVEIDSMLTESAGGLDDIHAFLDTLEGWHASGVPGCFMINSMIEFADRDAAITSRGDFYLDKLRAGLHAALTRARVNDELRMSMPVDSAADRLLLVTIGLNTAARTGLGTDRLRALYRSAHETVASLGTEGP
jgi:TetR/AcrR family transcriptional repressor of nem operon